MNKILPLALAAILATTIGASAALAVDDTQATTSKMALTYSDPILGPLQRDALVHLPANYLHRGVLPLVLNFHGGFSNANAQMLYTGMNTIADDKGFVVVYPNGIDQSWNAIIPSPAKLKGVDDFGFVQELIRQLKTLYPIDSTRVYATGISNGAQMAYTLGFPDSSQLPYASQHLAALGLVAAGVGAGQPAFSGTDGPAVIDFHGTADPRIPYAGGVGSGAVPFTYTSVWDGLLPIILNNLKDFKPATGYQPYTGFNQAVATDVAITSWQSQAYSDPARLVFVKLIGGGHTWPGGDSNSISDQNLGPTNQNISASQAIWNFFANHHLITNAKTLTPSLSEVGLAGNLSVVQLGGSYQINWHSANTNRRTMIMWFKKSTNNGKRSSSITGYITPKATPASNLGTYNWTIPTTTVDIYPIKQGSTPTKGVLPLGSDYTIQVYAVDDSGNVQSTIGTSSMFTITSAQVAALNPVNNQSSVIESFSTALRAWFQRLFGF